MRRLASVGVFVWSMACGPGQESGEVVEAAPVQAVQFGNSTWSRVTFERTLPGGSFVRARHDFGGRITLPRGAIGWGMMESPVVLITPTAIFFDGQPVARITGGEVAPESRDPTNEYMLPGLHAPLQAALQAARAAGGATQGERVTLFADQGVPFAVIVAVVFTSGRAGALDYQFAVAPTGTPSQLGSDVLLVSPPKYATGNVPPPAKPDKLALLMMVSRTDVRIGQKLKDVPARSRWIERVPLAYDRGPTMRRIAELARTVAAEETWAPGDVPLVFVGAERDVPLGLLVEALSAAAGPACVFDDFIAQRPHQCLFLAPVLHGDSPAPELGP